MSTTDKTSLKEFAKAWRETGSLLEQIRFQELAALTEEQARQQTIALFSLWKPGFNKPTSGLVEQQRLFQKLHRLTIDKKAQ